MTRPRDEFTERVIAAIKQIPAGKVATYGQIAAIAGDRRAARQVARILHSCSSLENLPWRRVINSKGAISLPPGPAREEQLCGLQNEGVFPDSNGLINLPRFLWNPAESDHD